MVRGCSPGGSGVLHAGAVFTGRRWLENVTVEWRGGVIRSVARGPGRARSRGVVLLPGLVNAHTHLELTALRGRLPPGPFPEWAKALVAVRSGWSPRDLSASMSLGIRLSVEAGTTAVGDFVMLSPNDALRQAPLRGVSWREVLGIAPEQAGARAAWAGGFLEGRRPHWTPGLAPHAPYSVSAPLYRMLRRTAFRAKVPFATHLSELREEIEFLRTGRGVFADMLRSFGRDTGSWRPPRMRPAAWLDSLGVLRGATVVHANYLTAADIAALRRNRAVVVWCPRTHDFFGHSAHPVRRLLDAGVRVALGTDSLASAPSLSVRDEILHASRVGLPLETLLCMATENGARALGLRRVGRIAPGWAADFTLVEGSGPADVLRGPIAGRVLNGSRSR